MLGSAIVSATWSYVTLHPGSRTPQRRICDPNLTGLISWDWVVAGIACGPTLKQAFKLQYAFELIGIEADERLIADHDQRNALTAEFEETLLHFAGLADIEIEKRDLVLFQPALEVLAVGAAQGCVDHNAGCLQFELFLHVYGIDGVGRLLI